jgi:uncharacterized protein with beta-barrel porin domain
LSGRGTVALGNKTLIIENSNDTEFCGVISGKGSVVKRGTGTFKLKGETLDLGAISVEAGELEGTTKSLKGNVNIQQNARLILSHDFEGDFFTSFEGQGTIVYRGNAEIKIHGDSDGFKGGVELESGALKVLGHLGGQLNISSNAKLRGNGSTGSIINRGNVSPGASIGTLKVIGDYIQTSSGNLLIEIDPEGHSSLLDVEGKAYLSGNLIIEAHPGVYLKDHSYTILRSSEINGVFTNLLQDDHLLFYLKYDSNTVRLLASIDEVLLPQQVAQQKGNAGRIANYIFCDSFPYSNHDLVEIVDIVLNLPTSEFTHALRRFTPAQMGGLSLAGLENNYRMGNTFISYSDFYASCGRNVCRTSKKPSNCYTNRGWLYPIYFNYQQRSIEEVEGFNVNTEGVSGGWDRQLSSSITLGVGIGYSHSNLRWSGNEGKAHWNSVYLGPAFGYASDKIYLSLLLLGSGNFYDLDRKIQFAGLSRTAHSFHRSLDVLMKGLFGSKLLVLDKGKRKLFLQPEIMVDYINMFEEGFKENGAGVLNLSVQRKYSAYLRSLVDLKATKEWCFSNGSFAMNVMLGWLGTSPLTSGNYIGRFRGVEMCKDKFVAKSFHKYTNQLAIGAAVEGKIGEKCSLSLGYNGTFGEGAKVNEAKFSLQTSF